MLESRAARAFFEHSSVYEPRQLISYSINDDDNKLIMVMFFFLGSSWALLGSSGLFLGSSSGDVLDYSAQLTTHYIAFSHFRKINKIIFSAKKKQVYYISKWIGYFIAF